MKYSLTGHSCVQEVDNMHKQIEDAMRVAEFYSQISFIRVLLKVNRNHPDRVKQMAKEDFKDYMNASKLLQFNLIPFMKVLQLKFSNDDLHRLDYKLSHGDQFSSVYIGRKAFTRHNIRKEIVSPIQTVQRDIKIVEARRQTVEKEISREKKKDLISMLKYMPLIDQQYFNSIRIV